MQPLWILCNPRTGSSLLSEYLNNTMCFSNYDNPRIQTANDLIDKNAAFGEWLRVLRSKDDFESHPPIFMKNIFHQHMQLFEDNNNADYIKKIIPNIRFIHLKRSNVKEHIISQYFAEITNTWHVLGGEELSNYQNIQVPLDIDLLRKCCEAVASYNSNWDYFLKGESYLTIYYENLVDNPHKILSNINDFYNLLIDDNDIARAVNNNRFMKMKRPEFDVIMNYLSAFDL